MRTVSCSKRCFIVQPFTSQKRPRKNLLRQQMCTDVCRPPPLNIEKDKERGKNTNITLKCSQAPPTCPSDRGSTKVETLRWLEAVASDKVHGILNVKKNFVA
jgi:hypothetical protein